MTPKSFFQSKSKDVVKAVAETAGTTFENFQQIALYGGSCSSRMAKRLAEASEGSMSIHEILYPEDHEESAA